MAEYKIKGWAARDKWSGESNLYIGYKKPKRILDTDPGFGMWCDFGEFMELPKDMFPNLKWEDEPIKVEITIKECKDENDESQYS